jgi:uncharacterized protein
MLKLEEGKQAVFLARKAITYKVEKNLTFQSDLKDIFLEKRGVFVTLHLAKDHTLRGCIGIPYPVMTLKDAIIQAAESVTHDPRFPALSHNELDAVIVELTILTKPELISTKTPQDVLSGIEIGIHGLIIEYGPYAGLLLPQVAVEQGWNKEEFLSNTCLKAGLPANMWKEKNVRLFTFQGQIFTELKPKADVVEKTINGSNN